MSIERTELGHQVVRDRSIALTPRQRSALILVDGKRSLTEFRAAALAAGAASEDMERLFELGLVRDGTPQATAAAAAKVVADEEAAAQHKLRTPQERYAEAYPIATRLTAGLGLRGFRLNLAVEGATDYDALLQVAPRIREAVGADKYAPLERALNDR